MTKVIRTSSRTADANRRYAAKATGPRTTDAGDTWTKLRREFGEIRALAWMPN
jgi:hypothetical protein